MENYDKDFQPICRAISRLYFRHLLAAKTDAKYVILELEQSILSEGATAAEAIANTVVLAKEADALGYHRLWLSEHHNLSVLQGSVPEVLLAAIGAQTKRIRIGSGGQRATTRIPWAAE